MAEPAKLTSALLARKGQALPTGGFAHAKLALIPPQPSSAKLRRQCCETTSEGSGAPIRRLAPELGRQARPVAGGRVAEARVAFTLPLDPVRHLRLKVLAARRGRSGQAMLLRALDAYLEACAIDCPCMHTAHELEGCSAKA